MAIKRLSGLEDNVVVNGIVRINPNTITANYTFPAGYNGVSAGPIIIADNVTVTIPSGCEWAIQ